MSGFLGSLTSKEGQADPVDPHVTAREAIINKRLKREAELNSAKLNKIRSNRKKKKKMTKKAQRINRHG
jgi:hypothetical protein